MTDEKEPLPPETVGWSSFFPKLKLKLNAVVLKRVIVGVSATAALYFAIGAFFFPEWYFGIFWGGRTFSGPWWNDAFSYWLDLHTGLLAIYLVLAFVVALAMYSLRRFFLPLVDRFALRLVAGFCMVVLVTAVLDRKYARTSFDNYMRLDAAMDNLKTVTQQLISMETNEQSDLEVPIGFQYLDRARIDGLYSEIEPELVEKQRTVSATESLNEKGKVTLGPAEGEVGAGKQKGATSSFERASFSSERKCIQIMKYALSQKTAHFYTTSGEWFGRRLFKTFREDIDKAFKQAESSEPREVTKEDLKKLRTSDQPPTEEQQKETKRRELQYSQEFESELKSLNGLVLVDSTFVVHHNSQNDLILVDNFSEKPLHIVFRVLVPEGSQVKPPLPEGKSRLRVFGTVTRQLNDSGVIEVRAIALY